jgi:hypothetical protein
MLRPGLLVYYDTPSGRVKVGTITHITDFEMAHLRLGSATSLMAKVADLRPVDLSSRRGAEEFLDA